MSALDWRVWLYEKLTQDTGFTNLLPAAQVHGSGSLTQAPDVKPFLIVHMEPEVPGPFRGVSAGRCTLWAHDEPGDYMQIDAILYRARLVLAPNGREGSVNDSGGVSVVWQGNSGDLSDPDYRTIVRSAAYDLHGRD